MLKKLREIISNKKNLPIVLLLIFSAYLRLYKINEYQNFLGDEGRDVLIVKHILDGFGYLLIGNFKLAAENLTLLGPTASVGGFFLGPIYYYFMAPFLFVFNYNPVGPAVMVALVGVLTVFLLYFIVNKFFGYYSALISSFLYSISPLVIVYSRSSWNPNVVPFFALLMIYLLYYSTVKKSWKYLFLCGVVYGILLQLHYIVTFLGVVVFLYLILSSAFQYKSFTQKLKKILIKGVYFGLGTAVGWSPFILFEARHNFQNTKSIFQFIFESGETGGSENYFKIINDVFFRLFGRLIFAFPKVEDLHLYSSVILNIWGLIIYIIAVFSLIVFISFFIKSIKEKNEKFYFYLLLILWLSVGVFLFGLYKKNIYDYYFGFMFPLPFILIGSLCFYLSKKGRVINFIIFLSIFILTFLNIYFRPFKFLGNNQVNQVKVISEFVMSKTEGKPYNFAVISNGGNSDHAYRYFFEINNRKPVTIEFPGVDKERKTVTDQLLIVCESIPCHPLGYPLWEVAGFGQAEIVGEWPVSILKVYKLKHFKGS